MATALTLNPPSFKQNFSFPKGIRGFLTKSVRRTSKWNSDQPFRRRANILFRFKLLGVWSGIGAARTKARLEEPPFTSEGVPPVHGHTRVHLAKRPTPIQV